MKLKLADSLALPADEAITQKYGFIGRSGSGKSYAAMRLAELFLQHGAQIIALDWVGIWWSLRLAANGKAPGFEHVYIFGGEHADLPLEPTAGALVADLVVDKHISVVLDVMHFRKAERTRFATAFAEQFFHRKKTARTACHLFIEEAQAYLPQLVRGDEARMVGVFEDLGKVGRNYGIGNSLISQRPQAINKDVLNQVEVLLAFQTNGPQERKAIAGWTAENTTAGAAMIQELPTLTVGDALVWSPQWLRLAERVHISARETYDASSTPTLKAKAIAPKTLAKADLEQLGEAMKATVEKAKADDPRELRKQLAAAREALTKLQVHAAHLELSVGVKGRHVEVLTDTDRALLEKIATRLNDMATLLRAGHNKLLDAGVAVLEATVRNFRTEFADGDQQAATRFGDLLEQKGFQKILSKLGTVQTATNQPPIRPPLNKPVPRSTPAQVVSGRSRPPASTNGASSDVTPAKQKILNGLAFLQGIGVPAADKTQLALIVSVSPTSGGYFNNLGALRSSGLIDYPSGGTVALTDAGAAIASTDGVPTTTDELHDAIQRKLPPAKWKILDALIQVYPKAVSKDDLAETIDVSPTSGGYFNNLGSLRSLGLVDYPQPGTVAAQPVLFLE